MNETYIRSSLALYDENVLWMIDEVIGGLYMINLSDFKSKCVIDSYQLFKYGKFISKKLIDWNNIYIIIIPQEAHKKWIFYNKLNHQIQYRDIIHEKCLISGALNKKNMLFLYPLTSDTPLITVDLEKMKYSKIILDWDKKNLLKNKIYYSWKGINIENQIYFPFRESKILIKWDTNNKKIYYLKIDLPENIGDIDYNEGELWVLPMKGSKIYQVDFDGGVIGCIDLCIENAVVNVFDYVRIIVEKKYIFLLPYIDSNIYIYNKIIRKKIILDNRKNKLQNILPLDKKPAYWGYCDVEERLYILPLKNKLLSICLDNALEWEEKKLYLPLEWSNKDIKDLYHFNQMIQENNEYKEDNKNSLQLYVNFLKKIDNKNSKNKAIKCEKNIWDLLKDCD